MESFDVLNYTRYMVSHLICERISTFDYSNEILYQINEVLFALLSNNLSLDSQSILRDIPGEIENANVYYNKSKIFHIIMLNIKLLPPSDINQLKENISTLWPH